MAIAQSALSYATDIPHQCQLSIPSTPVLLAEIDGALHGCHRAETRLHECRSWARSRASDEIGSPVHKRPRICDYGLQMSAASTTGRGGAFPDRTYTEAGSHQRTSCRPLLTINLSSDPSFEQTHSIIIPGGQQWKHLVQLLAPAQWPRRAAGCSDMPEVARGALDAPKWGPQCGAVYAMPQLGASDNSSVAPGMDLTTTRRISRGCLVQLRAGPQPHGRAAAQRTEPASLPCGRPGVAQLLPGYHHQQQQQQQQVLLAAPLQIANAAVADGGMSSCRDHMAPCLHVPATCSSVAQGSVAQAHLHQNMQQLKHQSQLQLQPPQQQQLQQPWPDLSMPLAPRPVVEPLACHLCPSASTAAPAAVLMYDCSIHNHQQPMQWQLQPQPVPQQQLGLSWQLQQPLQQQQLKRPYEQLQSQQQQQELQQPRRPYKQQSSTPFFTPATPPLDADAPCECILLLCKALCMSECTTARLALHIWNRIRGMVRLVLSVRTPAHVQRHGSPSVAASAAAAADRVYAVAALWLASKLEESRRTVPAVCTLAAVARTPPSVFIAAELRVLQWCEWSPYAGFVPDDAHLLIDL